MIRKNRLKALRKEKRLTIRELEEKLNINRTTLSRIENGLQGINNEYLTLFSQFYNVSTDYILGLTDIPDNNVLSNNLDAIKNSGQYELNKDLSDEELEVNLDEILTKYDIKFQGKTLLKEEIKDIVHYAKFRLSQRDDNHDDD